MLLFDMERVCRTKYSPNNKYSFSSFNNDRGLSLDDKTKDCVDRNTGGHSKYTRYMRTHNSGNIHSENLHILAVALKKSFLEN